MKKHRIHSLSVESVVPHYVAEAEKNGGTKSKGDRIICWPTGHSQTTLDDHLAKNTGFEESFAKVPA